MYRRRADGCGVAVWAASRGRVAVTAVAATLLIAASPMAASGGIIYEVNTTGATETGSKNNNGVYIGQSFNSGANTLLTSAQLQINREGLSVANFTLTLHAVTGSASNYFTTGSALASGTYSNSILSETLGTFYEFANLNWAMSPNTVYMIGISSASEATVKWTLNQSGTQSTSTGFITGYAGYNSQEGSSKDNGLHGAVISAVPEPSALAIALAGLALGGSSAWRRRRRAGPPHGARRRPGRGANCCGRAG